jgi:hypothetical protein
MDTFELMEPNDDKDLSSLADNARKIMTEEERGRWLDDGGLWTEED